MTVAKYCHFTLDWSTQSGSHLRRINIRTVRFDSDSIANLEAKIWKLFPEGKKASKTCNIFQSKIKR